MLKGDFAEIIKRVWDKADGGFQAAYFTEGRLSAIYETFKGLSPDLCRGRRPADQEVEDDSHGRGLCCRGKRGALKL